MPILFIVQANCLDSRFNITQAGCSLLVGVEFIMRGVL